MSDEAYPLQETGRDEEFLFFSANDEEQACIGHLRGDFGSGTEFYTTWWDHQEELKDQDFKDELDKVVNTLRENGPLKDLRVMQSFCWKHAQARMSPESGKDHYGFRVDTAMRRYYLRFLPLRGNYNFYIYCYQTDKLERSTVLPSKEDKAPQYDLSSAKALHASAKLARARADEEPNQDSYNAAWLHGYAAALTEATRQMEPQKKKRRESHER